jgi:hypothetical protein
LAAGGLFGSLPGCGEDEEAVGAATVLKPAVKIVHPAEGACISVGDDPKPRILVQVSVEDLLLRPPGLCGSTAGCGHLEVRVNGVLNNIGSAAVMDVLLEKLAAPFGERAIEVRAVNDAGEPLMNTGVTPSTPVTATVNVTTKFSCEGGAGGAGGAGGSGGAGMGGAGGAGLGGAGGAGGAGMGGAGGAGGSGGN